MMVFSASPDAGQGTVNQTRILAPRSRYDEILAVAAVTNFAALPGGPAAWTRQKNSRSGPLISEKQRTRVENYIAKGHRGGARLIVCGGGRPEGLDNGFFIQPTSRCRQQDDHREEIFGPVLAIILRAPGEDAIAIARRFSGLAGSVWTTDVPKASRSRSRSAPGHTESTGTPSVSSPFIQELRNHYENRPEGVEHFTQLECPAADGLHTVA